LSWNGRVDGITQLQQAEAARYGPGSYVPVLWVTYWGFRIMVGLGFLMLIVSAWSLWRSKRGGKPFEMGRWTLWVLVACIAAPFLANTAGWLFTEMGRQPWIVYGLMKTGQAASPTVSATDVALTFGGFVLLYTVLGIIDAGLMYQAARRGLGTGAEEPPSGPPREGAEELVY
jgi:cytochrome d ubiquinol oxidase subunit I